MIKVIIKQKQQQILEIKLSGHADSAENGKDLICAGVTISLMGVANELVKQQFLSQEKGTIDIREGFAYIKVNHSNSAIQVVLETFVTILETIEESHSKYIKITKMEVENHDV